MIVLFGRTEDRPLVAAAEQAAAANVPHLLLDQARLGDDEMVLDVGSDGLGGRLRTCSMEVELGDISAVYARPLTLPTSTDRLAGARSVQLNASFLEWIDEARCLVVNRPEAMRSNMSKPYQLQLIAERGLRVPETLITNRPEDVHAFHARHGRVIYKSISGIRSIVRELDEAALANVDRVRSLPTQFQAYVDGVDVRVHVVGDRAFATEIASEATDYRYAHRDGGRAELRAAELPPSVELRCHALANALELPFCGIDLRRRPDGEHVCLEVNPMPGYSYFESETGQPIAEALVDLLSGAVG